MYSRSERKFLQPEKDKANPNLGPGCYTSETLGKHAIGYAPFSSLAPRVSYFEQVAGGPPPGSYDVDLAIHVVHKSETAALFGKSRTVRFVKNVTDAPAPDTYAIPSTIQLKPRSKLERKRPPMGALNQKPCVLENTIEELESMQLDEKVDKEGDGEMKAKGTSPHVEISVSLARQKRQKLQWKRKHVPPSIPKGTHVYGYQENEEGEMVPKKPHKKVTEEAPPYLFSFAEKAKHENRGHGFAKSRQGLTFKTLDNPGPDQYDLQKSQVLKKGKNPALVALAPCKRLTDEIIATAVKQSVPGPASLEAKLAEPRNRIRFGGAGVGSGHINEDLMKLPGPGSYFPEQTFEKPVSKKPKPFGSSTKRFEYLESREKVAPAVGSYEIEQTNSIYQKVKKNAVYYHGQPFAPFGSIANRFVRHKPQEQPGPGAYELDAANHEVDTPGPRQGKSTIQKLAQKGPIKVQLGDTEFFTGRIHIPVFGTQSNRFEEKQADLPPPGAYDISESFEQMKSKGKIPHGSVLTSKCPRDIFKVKEQTPSPGQYSIAASPTKKEIRKKIGAFLSTNGRFIEKYEDVPGPGSYQNADSVVLKKSFNITFSERKKLAVI